MKNHPFRLTEKPRFLAYLKPGRNIQGPHNAHTHEMVYKQYTDRYIKSQTIQKQYEQGSIGYSKVFFWNKHVKLENTCILYRQKW